MTGPLHIPAADPPIPSPERIAACVVACNGLSTEQLVGMNAEAPGLLARAYDVCSALWEWHGIEIVGEHAINGTDAVVSLRDVSADVEAVVQWARESGVLDAAKGDRPMPASPETLGPVCARCGGTNLSLEATVSWDYERGEAVVNELCDKGHVCEDCGGETRIVFKSKERS